MPIPKEVVNIERTTAKNTIYETLKQWIIEGKLKPAEKISDIEIAEHFSVSRTPVREAIQLLEMQKLVQTFPGRATVITEMETDNIEQFYLPLSELQKLAVSLAIEKAEEKDIQHLQTLNNQFRDTIPEKNALKSLYADIEFHRYILELSDNVFIQDFCDTLMLHILRLEYLLFKGDYDIEESVREHAQIISAFERKDVITASMCIKNNWNRSLINVQHFIHKGL